MKRIVDTNRRNRCQDRKNRVVPPHHSPYGLWQSHTRRVKMAARKKRIIVRTLKKYSQDYERIEQAIRFLETNALRHPPLADIAAASPC